MERIASKTNITFTKVGPPQKVDVTSAQAIECKNRLESIKQKLQGDEYTDEFGKMLSISDSLLSEWESRKLVACMLVAMIGEDQI